MHNNNKRRPNNMNGGNGGNGGSQHRHNNNNRPRRFTNNRPGGDDPANATRTRRSATQNREKYQMMARDALSAGDRVLAEYYLQHADHYHRVLLALPPEEAPRPQYLRGHQPQNGEQQPGGDQQHSEVAQNSPVGEESLPPAHGLPSFITQPGGGEQETPENPGQ